MRLDNYGQPSRPFFLCESNEAPGNPRPLFSLRAIDSPDGSLVGGITVLHNYPASNLHIPLFQGVV